MKCNKTVRLVVDALKKTVRLLLHVLIIVILVVIIQAALFTIFPIRWDNRIDAKLSNLTTNLLSVRAQLELYRSHHNGTYPTDINTQLTSKSDADGTINQLGAYGPYMQQFPANPFVDDAAQAVKTSGSTGGGWDYDPATGVIVAKTPGHEGL